MSNRRKLWLSLLVVALAVLPGLQGGADAAQYAVVANSGSGAVSLIENSGSGWMGVADSALNVGGTPWGVATSGQYAFVANQQGHVDVFRATVNGSGQAWLNHIESIDVGARAQWVAASSDSKIYVSTLGPESGTNGSVYQLTYTSGSWIPNLLNTGAYYYPQGLAVIPAAGGSQEKLAVAKDAMVGSGKSDQVQIFQDGASVSSQSFSDGMPMHVAPWIQGSQQFAVVTRRAATQPGGLLTAFNAATGSYYELILQYSPYAVAVVDNNAYVTDYNSQRIYKYSLTLTGEAPTMDPVSSFGLGDIGGVRQIISSGDGYLLVTSNAGNTVHSINLSNFGPAGASTVGTFSGAVGIGVIDPLAISDPIPEPSALATLATGLLAVAGGLRRKGRRKEG